MSELLENDSRDVLWDKVFETYYDSLFEETAADLIVDLWMFLDDITKVLVALTAVGSGISGWTLWNDPNLKYIWAILAGAGVVLSIVHAALNVQEKIKYWEDIKRSFIGLRIKLETFRHRMEINPDFPLNDFEGEYIQLRNEFAQLFPRIKTDILRRKYLLSKAQNNVNVSLESEIEQ